jgi:hypothetical protein
MDFGHLGNIHILTVLDGIMQNEELELEEQRNEEDLMREKWTMKEEDEEEKTKEEEEEEEERRGMFSEEEKVSLTNKWHKFIHSFSRISPKTTMFWISPNF